jgi:hypothetical protein
MTIPPVVEAWFRRVRPVSRIAVVAWDWLTAAGRQALQRIPFTRGQGPGGMR